VNIRKWVKRMLIALAAFIGLPFLIPERAIIPVQGATSRDWNQESFWYEPWGKSGVHKGIDIFAPSGRPVIAPVPGIVVYSGQLGMGGNVVAVLGPKWRIHYFAHLSSNYVGAFDYVSRSEVIGSVGTSGNAAGKPPHLHYAVLSVIPLPWRATTQAQGWKRMFFVDPGQVLVE
jgi:peptidoglycan LD-endopeptidase LytH